MGKTLRIKDGRINFCCRAQDCKHPCCGPFSGISNELDNIDGRPFDEIVLTENDRKSICENGFSHLVEEGYSPLTGKKYYKMALQPDGTCKAWVDGKCLIHDFSPAICRAFPFYYDMFSGLCAITCDGFGDDRWTELSEHGRNLDAAREMYDFWLRFYDGSKDK